MSDGEESSFDSGDFEDEKPKSQKASRPAALKKAAGANKSRPKKKKSDDDDGGDSGNDDDDVHVVLPAKSKKVPPFPLLMSSQAPGGYFSCLNFNYVLMNGRTGLWTAVRILPPRDLSLCSPFCQFRSSRIISSCLPI